jgi:rSAM/selenodomain-associated transferase 2
LRLSVIIPTLNEESSIGGLIGALQAQDPGCEIIVSDGGSTDRTREVSEANGARVLQCAPGRGQQAAAGADTATGDILFFCHADTALPDGALDAVCVALEEKPEAPGGNFRLLFDGGTGFDDWLNGFYAWIRSHGVYYGDSGIFVRREAYISTGGIRPIALMEDYDFVRRLERTGPTVCIGEPPLITSSRKFHGRHPVGIVCGWLWIHALWHLGVSPDRLARIYYGRKFRTPVSSPES